MAAAFGNAMFTLWVGSGISFKRAPDLGDIIRRALEFLRARAVDAGTQEVFDPAFRSAIELSQTPIALVEPHLATPLAEWPEDVSKPIVEGLWNRYSQLLNIPIAGEDEDYILWTAADIREAFANDNAIVIHADEAWHEMQEANIIDSPRTISRSPGRNGMIGTQHVSMARMIAGEATAEALSARFVREVSL